MCRRAFQRAPTLRSHPQRSTNLARSVAAGRSAVRGKTSFRRGVHCGFEAGFRVDVPRRSLAGGWGAGGTIGESKPGRAAHHLHARPGRHGRTRDVSGDRDGSLACGSVAVAFEGHQRSANCLRLPSAVFGLVGWCGWLAARVFAGLVGRGEVGDSATELVARRATGLMVTL